MKNLATFVFISALANLPLYGQLFQPDAYKVSYFGEMMSHPGLKAGVVYELKQWEKKRAEHSLAMSPSLGFYYHRRYQTGLFFLPELGYLRTNKKGNSLGAGLEAGYLKTFIPNTFRIEEEGMVKTLAGYSYLVAGAYLEFRWSLTRGERFSGELFVKPQFLNALPGFPGGVGYFALEIGLIF